MTLGFKGLKNKDRDYITDSNTSADSEVKQLTSAVSASSCL